MKIFPRCIFFKSQNVSINYLGYVVPCCIFMNPRSFDELKNLLGDKIDQLHISNGSIESILKCEASEIIKNSYSKNPMPTCLEICGESFDKNSTPAGGKIFYIRKENHL